MSDSPIPSTVASKLPPRPTVRVGQKDVPLVWFRWAETQAYAESAIALAEKRARDAAIEECALIVEAPAEGLVYTRHKTTEEAASAIRSLLGASQ